MTKWANIHKLPNEKNKKKQKTVPTFYVSTYYVKKRKGME